MKGISYLQEPVMLLWIKQRPIYFKLKRSLTGNEFSYIKNTFFQKDFSYKYQFCAKVREPSKLVSEVWAKCKDVPSEILKTRCKLTKKRKKKEKIFVLEQYRQTSQKMMGVRKKQFKSFEVSAEDIGFISDCRFLLLFMNAFILGTEEYYTRCSNVNDAKGLQTLYNHCNIILHSQRL